MHEWPKVSWTDAGQVIAQLRPKAELPAGAELSPAAYARSLIDAGKLDAAVDFIGAALPRYEAVAWAAQTLRAAWPGARSDSLLAAVLQWLDDPNDARRRAIHAAARDHDGPTGLLGQAVFYSGGSISESDLPAVLPPPVLCGIFASTAVLTAAYGEDAPEAILHEAIAVGQAIAGRRD